MSRSCLWRIIFERKKSCRRCWERRGEHGNGDHLKRTWYCSWEPSVVTSMVHNHQTLPSHWCECFRSCFDQKIYQFYFVACVENFRCYFWPLAFMWSAKMMLHSKRPFLWFADEHQVRRDSLQSNRALANGRLELLRESSGPPEWQVASLDGSSQYQFQLIIVCRSHHSLRMHACPRKLACQTDVRQTTVWCDPVANALGNTGLLRVSAHTTDGGCWVTGKTLRRQRFCWLAREYWDAG